MSIRTRRTKATTVDVNGAARSAPEFSSPKVGAGGMSIRARRSKATTVDVNGRRTQATIVDGAGTPGSAGPGGARGQHD
jgi:hypothetical protein